MIKLIIADCDGTILDANKEIDSQLKCVIQKLQESGITFTLASGRNIYLMQAIVKELDLRAPFITNNGANIYQNNEMVANYTLPKEYMNTICQTLKKNSFPFLAYSKNELIISSSHRLLEGFINKLKGKLTQTNYETELDLSNTDFFKITVATDHQSDIDIVKKVVEEKCPRINFKRSEGTLFTITSLEATKGNAIKTIGQMLDIQQDEILVFGDNYNDITMFEVAGVSVAMGNSDDEIKRRATHETKDNDHNGVSSFLIDYFDL